MQQERSQHLYTQAADRRLQFVIQQSQVANRNSEPRFFPEEDERRVLQRTVYVSLSTFSVLIYVCRFLPECLPT